MTIAGPITFKPGSQLTYTATNFSCFAYTPTIAISLPTGWVLLSQSYNTGVLTFTVLSGASGGNIGVSVSCIPGPGSGCQLPCEDNSVIGVNLATEAKTNIGICCDRYAVAILDISTWVNNTSNSITLTINFANEVDAVAALGAYSFTSTSNVTIAACLANLVSQINAAAAANPSGNPEGPSPASLLSGQLQIVSWPTPSDMFTCGDTHNFPYGFEVICNHPSYVTMLPVTTANFEGGGVPINCQGPPSVTGSPFVCTGTQVTFTITFPIPVPYGYQVIIPTGWTLVSTVITGVNTIAVTVIPNNTSGNIVVSYMFLRTDYTSSYSLINDCFISNCASELMLSQFCHDIDPCCKECDDYVKSKRKVEKGMYNKAIGLITTYSLLKQNYFLTCNSNDLPVIQKLANQLKSILIRCGICPKI